MKKAQTGAELRNPVRVIKLFTGIYVTRAHVSDLIDSSEATTPELFT